MDNIIKYWSILLLVVNVFALWISWSIKRGLVSPEDLSITQKPMNDKIYDLDRRVSSLENCCSSVPKHADHSEIVRKLAELKGEIHGFSSQFEGLRNLMESKFRLLDLLTENHLKR